MTARELLERRVYLPATQAARVAGITKTELDHAVETGLLTPVPRGKTMKFQLDKLFDYIIQYGKGE